MKASEPTALPVPANESKKPTGNASARLLHQRVVLIQIRHDDGAQQFRYGPGMMDILWLKGIGRCHEGKVGDTGKIWYVDGIMTFERIRE